MTDMALPSSRIYPGWWVVVGLFLAGMMVYGAGLYGFSLLIPPLSAEFGWSRAATGGLVSVFWLAAPLTMLGGYVLSRIRAGWVVCLGVVLSALCMAGVGLTDSLVVMYALRTVMGLGKIMMMAGVSAQAAAWFRRRFGLASATCFAGWHFGGLTLAPLAQWMIDLWGWRTACFALAVMIAGIALPPMLLWGCRRAPDDLGAEGLGGRKAVSRFEAEQADVKMAEILRQPRFWMLIVITLFGGFAYGAPLTHEVALLQSAGVSPSTAALALSLTAGAALVGAMVIGYLSDHCSFRLVMGLTLTLMFLGVGGFLLILQGTTLPVLFPSALAFGLSVGGFDTSIIARLPRVFGPKAFAHVFGVWYFFFLAILLVGPMIVGRLFDLSGSYVGAAVAVLVAIAVSAAMLVGLSAGGGWGKPGEEG